jgi:hypothetical protein
MEVGGQIHAPSALLTGNIPGAHNIGGCMGPRADLDDLEKTFLMLPGFEPQIFHS